MNQCDGCQRGLPVVTSARGEKVHIGNGYDRIGCTAGRYRAVVAWTSNGTHVTATRGHLSASTEAPIRGSYTDARLWLSLLQQAVRVVEGKLEVLEFKERV